MVTLAKFYDWSQRLSLIGFISACLVGPWLAAFLNLAAGIVVSILGVSLAEYYATVKPRNAASNWGLAHAWLFAAMIAVIELVYFAIVLVLFS